jgi:hypothetical protein
MPGSTSVCPSGYPARRAGFATGSAGALGAKCRATHKSRRRCLTADGTVTSGLNAARMAQVEIRIRFAEATCAAELEVLAPLYSDAAARIWGVLASLQVTPWSSHLVRTDHRLITSATMTERDGSPLSTRRARQVLQALRVALSEEHGTSLGPTQHPIDWCGVGLRKCRTPGQNGWTSPVSRA